MLIAVVLHVRKGLFYFLNYIIDGHIDMSEIYQATYSLSPPWFLGGGGQM